LLVVACQHQHFAVETGDLPDGIGARLEQRQGRNSKVRLSLDKSEADARLIDARPSFCC
jgi:hypothetical protein